MLAKMATDLFEHKRIITTEAKAKELRPYAERLIGSALKSLNKEKQGKLPEGQKIDVHGRRMIGRFIRNKEVLQELFDTIAPTCEERSGGYSRVVKIDYRRGDSAPKAIIELVDWSAPQEGKTELKPKKKKSKPQKSTKPATESKQDETMKEPEATEETEEAGKTEEGKEQEQEEKQESGTEAKKEEKAPEEEKQNDKPEQDKNEEASGESEDKKNKDAGTDEKNDPEDKDKKE